LAENAQARKELLGHFCGSGFSLILDNQISRVGIPDQRQQYNFKRIAANPESRP